SSCPEGGYNNFQPQFGPGCMYRCHCVGDIQCDYITGNCSKGCAAGWMGPGCQYGDIAYKKQVQQLLYGSNVFIDGSIATDGLPTTCIESTTLMAIDLNATYQISGLVITLSDTVNSAGYEVRVGNSSDPSLAFVDTCFKQTITHQLDSSTDVMCTHEIFGRYILIRTPDNATTMALCDVRVYGERLSGFSVSFATNSYFKLVFKHPETTPPVITEVITLSENYAQHVEISLKNTNQVALTLCEVFVFGDCQDDMCGWRCDIVCHCNGPITKQNIIDASCTSGCKTGWWGHSCNNTCHVNCKDNTCNQRDGYCSECALGKWGHFCDNNCMSCLDGTGCGVSDGICSVGCLTGYSGVSCGEHCGYCAVDGSCDRYIGACIHGCEPGWLKENCSIACPFGWYGIHCSNICGHCANTTCDHINGTCPFRCSEGYNGTRCSDRQEETSTESSSTLPIGIPVGGALGAVVLTILIILFAKMYWKRRKRAPGTSEIDHTYDQLDTASALQEKLSDYSKIEALSLSPVIPRENTYVNKISEKNWSEFRDSYQHYNSLDDQTGDLNLLSLFNSIRSPATTKTEVTRTGRADDCIESLDKSYLFGASNAKGKKEFTILSDFTTTSETIWRLALEHKIHLIIIIGENRFQFKPKVQTDIGLIQIECTDMTVERDLMLCNINVSECEKDTNMRNVQVILSAVDCSLGIPSNINETLAVLKKRLWLRRGIEAFNTLINCTPDARNGECFAGSFLMTDFIETYGYIDIIGIIEAMRKEKHDAINSFDKFKFCHDVIFKWIEHKENIRRM
ncbi:hypothetical protein ACJMK2_030618, partial [Sinanodonta woodiana]